MPIGIGSLSEDRSAKAVKKKKEERERKKKLNNPVGRGKKKKISSVTFHFSKVQSH